MGNIDAFVNSNCLNRRRQMKSTSYKNYKNKFTREGERHDPQRSLKCPDLESFLFPTES